MLTLFVLYLIGGLFAYLHEIQDGESDVAILIAIFYPLTIALAILFVIMYPLIKIVLMIHEAYFPEQLECQHDYEATTYRTLPRCTKCK